MITLRFKIEIEHITRGEDVVSSTTTLVFSTVDAVALSAIEDACHEATSYCERLSQKDVAK